MSGLRPFTDPPPAAASVDEAIAALVRAGPGDARARRRRTAARRPPARRGSRCCRTTPSHAGRGAARPPAAGAPRAAPRRWSPARSGSPCAAGRTTVEPVDAVPAPATTSRDAALVDRAAAGAAFEAVRRLELLLDRWGADPPSALRSGGLGVRDLRATATALHLDEPTVALLVETAAGAGLITTVADGAGNPVWLPTDLFDAGSCARPRSAGSRWSGPGSTARGCPGWWAPATRPARRGTRWPRSSPAVHMPETRRMTLAALAALPPGEVLAAGTGVPSRRRAARRGSARGARGCAPTRCSGRSPRPRPWASPGSTAWRRTPAGCWPTTTRPRRRPGRAAARAGRARAAPGRPHRGRTRPAGVRARPAAAAGRRRGVARRRRRLPLHAGVGARAPWTSAGRPPSCTSSSASVSRTPVPQPLEYLVDDTARTFGTIRVGHAEAYLRADDETALTELLHHPQAAGLGLRRLAPTVLVSSTPARRPPPPAARPRRRARGRGGRRHRPRRPARPAPGPDPARAPPGAGPARARRGPVRAAYGRGRLGRHRDPGRRPGRRPPGPPARSRPRHRAASLAALRDAAEVGAVGRHLLRRQPRHPHRAGRRARCRSRAAC